jgi:DNA-binding transcriptional ArsR family regulator
MTAVGANRSKTSLDMSNRRVSRVDASWINTLTARASVFAALGDETRLSMLTKLSDREPQSISRLTAGTNLSRQAVTKHLRVLANAGIVRSVRSGRESLFELEPQPIEEARNYLDYVSKQWDDALTRLKSHVGD